MLKLCFITLIIIVLFSFVSRINWTFYQVKSPQDSMLGPALKLIQENGIVHIDDIKDFQDLNDEEKLSQLRLLRNSITTLNKECADKNKKTSCSFSKRRSITQSILTLFTTWVYDEDKLSINNRTLYNWRSLTGVNVIVFTNCSKVRQISERAGLAVLPIIKEADGSPVLSHMFLEAQKNFESTFYGYANGDLLFTDGLFKTLQAISCKFKDKKQLLIVGKRTNVFADVLKDLNIQLGKEVEKYAFQFGQRFQPDAEDYFITDLYFPWASFLPLVIGRRGYDNWVVAYARQKNYTVIDTSDSVTCLHQTDKRGNFESSHKGNYNYDVIYSEDFSMDYGLWGQTYCARWRTWVDLCGNVAIGQRLNIPTICYEQRSFYWLYKLFKVFKPD